MNMQNLLYWTYAHLDYSNVTSDFEHIADVYVKINFITCKYFVPREITVKM